MSRDRLEDIRNAGGNPVRLPVLVKRITGLSCTAKGRDYFLVSVTDGEDSAWFPLYDGRIKKARDQFENKPVYITVKGEGEEQHISKIENCNDIPADTFEGGSEAVLPERTMLKELDPSHEVSVCLPLFITAIGEEKISKSGNHYFSVTATDGKEEKNFYVWDGNPDEIRKECLGKIRYLKIRTGNYPKVLEMKPCNEYQISEFIQTAPVPSEEMYGYITAVLKECSDTCSVGNVALRIYEEHKEELLRWPGALKLHHSVSGGLLYHTYRMLQSARGITKVYPALDMNLLCIGIALHDIGKLKELSTTVPGVNEFSADGTLTGHILLGIEMVDQAAWEMEEKPDPEEFRLVKHMIASHHGSLENGSPVVPATPEAMALNCLDLLDSRMDMFEQTMDGMRPGSVSGSVYALGGAHVYSRAKKNDTGGAGNNGEETEDKG